MLFAASLSPPWLLLLHLLVGWLLANKLCISPALLCSCWLNPNTFLGRFHLHGQRPAVKINCWQFSTQWPTSCCQKQIVGGFRWASMWQYRNISYLLPKINLWVACLCQLLDVTIATGWLLHFFLPIKLKSHTLTCRWLDHKARWTSVPSQLPHFKNCYMPIKRDFCSCFHCQIPCCLCPCCSCCWNFCCYCCQFDSAAKTIVVLVTATCLTMSVPAISLLILLPTAAIAANWTQPLKWL